MIIAIFWTHLTKKLDIKAQNIFGLNIQSEVTKSEKKTCARNERKRSKCVHIGRE